MIGRHVGFAGILLLFAGVSWAQGPQGAGQNAPQQGNTDQVAKALADYDAKIAEAQKEKDKQKAAGLRASAIDLISGYANQDKRIIDKLAKVIGTGTEETLVKTKAADALGRGLVDTKVGKDVLAALDHAFQSNEKQEDIAQNILNQMGRANEDETRKGAVKILDKIATPRANKFDDKHAITLAQAAIQGLGNVRVAEAVDVLIKIYPQVEQGKPAPPDPNEKNPPKQSQEEMDHESRRGQIEGALSAALTSLTAQTGMKTVGDWQKWWSQNKKSWKPQ